MTEAFNAGYEFAEMSGENPEFEAIVLYSEGALRDAFIAGFLNY